MGIKYKHLQILAEASAEQRMLQMLLENGPQIVEDYPELERTFRGISHRSNAFKYPGDLMRLHRMHHTGGSGRNRYDIDGKAHYWLYEDSARFFSNTWLGKEIRPFEEVCQIIKDKHEKAETDGCLPRVKLNLTRIGESLYWPTFWQREVNKYAWVATKLMVGLKTPMEICPLCGHGHGELTWIKNSLLLLGAVWGAGPECIGTGYVILKVTRADNGERYEI